jgi:hypothetical protein
VSQVKKITCPSCGANSVFKVNAVEYKCNYCQTAFRLEPGSPHGPPDLDQKFATLKELNAINPAQAKKVVRIAAVVGLSIVLFIIGMAVAIFSAAEKTSNASASSSWQQPSLNMYVAFAGTKGAVIWELLEYSGTKLDSTKHLLRLIDAGTGAVLAEKPFGETTTWKENFNFRKRFDPDFLLLRDTLYNGSEDGGLQAFDLYTGNKLLSNSDFAKKYPQLKTGITKVEARLYNQQFIFYTGSGDEYYYYPARNIFREKAQEDQAYRYDTVTRRNFYLSEGQKPSLYLITRQERIHERGIISRHTLEQYENGDRYLKKQFKTYEKLGDKIYPCAQRLISTKDFLILAYLSDFSKKPQLLIEKINANGKSLWQNRDTALAAFISNLTPDNLHLNYNYSNSEIVLYRSSSVNRSVGINLLNGKTSFVHTQGYIMD